MSAPTTSRATTPPATASRASTAEANSETPSSETPSSETSRVIKAGRVIQTQDAEETGPTEPTTPTTPTKPPKTKSTKTKGGKGVKVAKSKVKPKSADQTPPAKSSTSTSAAEKLIREEQSSSPGRRRKTTWLVAAVLGILVFQAVHAAEHVAQATYWLVNPTVAPWMSSWAMGLAGGLTALSGGTPALGMELLHLVGNALFFGGLLLAFRLPEQYRNPDMLRWLRLATMVQALHLGEHVLLTASVALSGKAIGLSTMFGLLPAGTPAASGYRVFFHLIVNFVALVFALRAVLAVRDRRQAEQGRTRTGYDWARTAILVSPVVGLLFLLPIFGGHVVHQAAADDAVVATVNGQPITNGELQAEVDNVRGQQTGSPLAAPAAAGTVAVDGAGRELSEDQLQFTVLNSLVQARLIEQGAAALGITITDADVDARRTKLIDEVFLNEAAYGKFLAGNNVSPEYERTQLRRLVTEERVQQSLTSDYVLSPQDVQAVFVAQYEGLPRARHLLTENEALAREFLSQVEAGADFEALIRAESTDPRAVPTGGYLGTVSDGAQVAEIVAAINGMADGEFSVVRTQFGWHVIQRLPAATLTEVEPEIRNNLLLNRMGTAGQEWISQLRAAAAVTLEDGYGVWNTQFGAVVSPEATG